MRNLISKHVAFTILLGILVIFTVIGLEDISPPHEAPHTFASATWSYLLKFGEHLGIAFLSIGFIGLLLELPHWQAYFHEQIVDTITEEKYLKKFDSPELQKIQTKLMKAFFKTEDIDKPDSFFRYYREKIQGFIGRPYRENTIGTTKVRYSPDGKSFIVEETILFVCRRLGEDIQEEVRWTTAKDEITGITNFAVTVTLPAGFAETDRNLPSSAVFSKDDADNSLTPVLGKWGYVLSLHNYKGIDGLQIKVEVTYVVAPDRAFSWTMPYISKGLTFTLEFPPELKVFTDLFVMEEVKDPDSSKPGVCVFQYPHWLLRGDGLAFHFRKLQ